MVTKKTLIVAFFPKNVPAEICLHEIIKKHSYLCSQSCHTAPIATTRDISQKFPDQEIIILNNGAYLSVFRTAQEIMKLIQQRWFREIAIVSCGHHARRLKRDLDRLCDGRINIYESVPQTRVHDFYLKNIDLLNDLKMFAWKKALIFLKNRSWTMLRCWTKEEIKKILPWPIYTFLALRSQ